MSIEEKHVKAIFAMSEYKSDGHISTSAVAAYMYFLSIGLHIGRHNNLCFDAESLQEWIGCSRVTANRAVRELKEKGFISITGTAVNQHQGISRFDIIAGHKTKEIDIFGITNATQIIW